VVPPIVTRGVSLATKDPRLVPVIVRDVPPDVIMPVLGVTEVNLGGSYENNTGIGLTLEIVERE
jgi:hypothetical protein